MLIKNVKSRKVLSITVVSIIILTGALFLWNKETIFGWFETKNITSSPENNNPANSKDTNKDAEGSNSVNSTDEASVRNNSNGLNEKTKNNSGKANDKKSTVTPMFTDASQYGNTVEVRAYINGIVESDGTCTFTFTKDAKTITKTSASLTNPNYTNCETVSVPTSEFASKGTWQLKISYQSPKSQGSASTSLEIK